MRRRLFLFTALIFVSCAHPPKQLPILGQVAPFQLTSQAGQTFDSATLAGHIWVADFIFTNCEGPCPRMSAYMRALQKATADLPDLKMVSFTVDPDRDSPSVMAEYAKRYHAEPERWIFLTGPKATLHHITRDVFKLGDVSGALEHSTRFALVDKKGRIRGFYASADSEAIRWPICQAMLLA